MNKYEIKQTEQNVILEPTQRHMGFHSILLMFNSYICLKCFEVKGKKKKKLQPQKGRQVELEKSS